MAQIPIERIRSIRSFPSLVKFLRDDLDWPLSSDEIDELVFEYEPDELGIDPQIAVNIKEIKQLRPLTANQPWGIFYIGFEPKRLPVVVLRRILQKLVIKKRQSAKSAHRNAWQLHDLLFISSYGEVEQRSITFAHFREDEESKLPTLRVIGWDSQDTPLHIDRCIAELEKLTFDEELSPDDWREEWSQAFTLRHRQVISNSKALARELSTLATRIRQRVNKVLAVESKKGPMRQLYEAFQETLVHDLTEDDFADMYAQTITYGLFSTKKSRPAGLVADNLIDMIPRTNPFLRELLSTFLTVGGRKGKIDFDELGIDDVVQTLRNTDMDAVLRDFGDSKPEEDPVIHFYEDFLKQYDAKKKVKRGVFYTPKPIVSFIVRSVDELLRKHFGLEDGLADTTTWGEISMRNKDIKIPNGVSEHKPFIQILDPATGTGTFLVEVIDVIYKTMTKKWERQGHMPLEFDRLWNEYVPKHLLPRLYGFELMMAPYAIAHMKIGLKLFETGYKFSSDERARIYLTNTLEESKNISGYFEQAAPALAHEAQAANKVKDEIPLTIVIGNPPYSKSSANRTSYAESLVAPYKDLVRSERNLQPLSDDYLKFLGYVHTNALKSSSSIIGMITNRGYLEGIIHRGIRKLLIDDFDIIHILDLHGDSNVGEKVPSGLSNENVFDIQQGVAICLLANFPNLKKIADSYDLWGTRPEKYDFLLSSLVYNVKWEESGPEKPYFFLRPKSNGFTEDTCNLPSLKNIFLCSNGGIKTHRDRLVVDFDIDTLRKRIKAFVESDETNGMQSRRYILRNDENYRNMFFKFLYRPFDVRYLFYHSAVIERPRKDVMRHMLSGNNVGLVSVRQVPSGIFNHAFVTRHMIEMKTGSHDRGASLFPLYLDESALGQKELRSQNNHAPINPNLNETFITLVSKSVGLSFKPMGRGDLNIDFGPEDLLHFIYAVLYSPNYRKRNAQSLRTDFPFIPITRNKELFHQLCHLGMDLVALHLLESDKINNHITTFSVPGGNALTKIGERGKILANVENGKGKLFINKTQYFDGLPEEVWNFHIGGYQVCHKWLSDRKKAGRKLSADDIEHYHKIVVAINETIKIMKQIDETIDTHTGWPIT